ncbi:hypothetical protein TNCV_5034721 [Trichonephila clavipes]|nr:hypothetical protein TNCV_5034721 [Trichonephila clavipes]
MLDIDISLPPVGGEVDEFTHQSISCEISRQRTVSLAKSQEPSEPMKMTSRYAGLPAVRSDSRMGRYFSILAGWAATRLVLILEGYSQVGNDGLPVTPPKDKIHRVVAQTISVPSVESVRSIRRQE